jgi:hypothetical protein
MRVPQLITASLVFLFASQFAAAEAPASPSYSADYVMETAEGAISGHLNVAPGKERRQDVIEGTTMVTIRRDDLNKLWMLMPSERMYMEIKPGQPGMGSRAPSPDEYETEMTTVGPEEVNGVATIKSKVIMTGADGSKMGGFWWTTPDGVLVKMDVIGLVDGDKMRMKRELTNIEIGPQADELFEIPSDYTSMGGMGMGMGMMGMPTDDAGQGVQ